jgi:hypothetical protein
MATDRDHVWFNTGMRLATLRPFLDPLQRASEVLFGLIMVLAYTGSISVLESGREDVHSILVGAIGCNLAWAIVDAGMHLMNTFVERARASLSADRAPGGLRYDDYMAATGVFLLVFLSTFPVIAPFLVLHDSQSALHLSQGIAMVLLYIAGWRVGRYAGRPPWRTGLTMALIGAVFATLTYVLGG